MNQLLFYTLSLLALIPMCISSGSCPPKMVRKMMSCLEILPKVSGDASFSRSDVPVIGNADPEEVERQCRDGSYIAAVECIENAISSCSKQILGMISELIDTSQLQNMINEFCQNTNVYRWGSPCLRRNKEGLQNCSRKQLEMQDQATTSSKDKKDINKMLDAICGANAFGMECTYSVLVKNCGSPIANLLQHLSKAPLSPRCNKVYDQFVSRNEKSQQLSSPKSHSPTITYNRALWTTVALIAVLSSIFQS
ncbi:uncharacterized protein LOC141902543 [Tubulanus polymorphus]|uniref:uncharacterized protein LOC141902543 n=1 Tax=Tubulanus polymorphus TaxID=672921 RepID=UPI003DA25741